MKHCDQVLQLLLKQVGNPLEVEDIKITAEKVKAKWINPLSGGKEQINGLIYGLVQSGKTGVLTTTGAIGADEGYKTIIILTSDIDPLYDQTLGRAQEAFPGMDIMGKKDIRDHVSFIQRIKANTCAIVITKNSGILKTLIQNFKTGKLKGLSCLIIDDEADQASLNTKAKNTDGSRSTINKLIEEIRVFFHKNTYLQVTATPQALFLQEGDNAFRPKFTILSHPGADYVGGDDFFSNTSPLVTEFSLQEINQLSPGLQPSPSAIMPPSLLRALDTFMIGATYKRIKEVDQNCAFLCHVSTKKVDHEYIVELLRQYKTDLAKNLKNGDSKTIKRLRSAFDDLSATHKELSQSNFDELLASIQFLSPGIAVKLVNGDTDEDVAVRSPYNLFVGGNKLGRGVTIKNLLVSYYGRNPKAPQADTVLQHARMYGYRRKDLGLLRLFLPNELHTVFKAIYQMEKSLRELIETNPTEEFRGIYLQNGLNATRKSVLAPGAVGVYTGGSNYNPAQVIRSDFAKSHTGKIDKLLEAVEDKSFVKMPITEICTLISLIDSDPLAAEHVWETSAISKSIEQYGKIKAQDYGFVYVDRNRDLKGPRRETQGILSGGEINGTSDTHLTLFILRTTPHPNENAAWWPQIRFPSGRYGFAFSI